MLRVFLLFLFVGGGFSHTYGNQGMFMGQQYPQYQQYPNFMIPSGGNVVTRRVETQRQQCCWVKQCRNGQCQESYACGDSCPNNPNFNFPSIQNNMQPTMKPTLQSRSSFQEPGEPQTTATEIKCCIVRQCAGNHCSETFTCGDSCSKYNSKPIMTNPVDPNTEPIYPVNQQANKPKPFLPSRNPGNNNNEPNMDFTPQFDPIPGITLDEKPKDREPTTAKPKTTIRSTTTKKPEKTEKPEKCDPSKIQYPEEDDEDYGPTPGYELKHEYTRKKCDKGSCKDVTFKCGQCPDPFDPKFRLYKVKKSCFQCYEISCNTPPPKK